MQWRPAEGPIRAQREQGDADNDDPDQQPLQNPWQSHLHCFLQPIDSAEFARFYRFLASCEETIDIALREYVTNADYDALLKLSGMGAIEADEPLLHEDRDFRSIVEIEPALMLVG
jgi:hypothetical protein